MGEEGELSKNWSEMELNTTARNQKAHLYVKPPRLAGIEIKDPNLDNLI